MTDYEKNEEKVTDAIDAMRSEHNKLADDFACQTKYTEKLEAKLEALKDRLSEIAAKAWESYAASDGPARGWFEEIAKEAEKIP